MMKSRIALVFVMTLMVSFTTLAQRNILNAKTPDEIGMKTAEQIAYDNDEPLPYGYVDERDVLWSKTTWEPIVLSN